ncbi:carboxymuconolactone decarboxylase family protein [Actinokineospora inagensis]|uniref:carboxymuconolactone decarboxylase family protein n=1 Tax=Actinokineospora inagensis TaxID=103730 RepID=UPI0003FA460D|nr:peroxidase-related enzyme [Actinokineospora inagensis]
MTEIRVPLVAETDATGATAQLYARIRAATGLPFVPDIFRLVSTSPNLLEVVVSGYTGMFTDSALPRATKELVAAWTSRLNDCGYCATTHNWFLRQFGGPESLADALTTAAGIDDLPIDAAESALLRLTAKVTEGVSDVDAEWVAATAHWTEEQVLEAVFCAALFAFINRLVSTLGLAAPTPAAS